MMKRSLMKLVVVVAGISLAGCSSNTPNQNVGVATGAVAGGLIGSTVGQGAGKAVAIGAGAVAGALIGGAVGKSMDEADRSKMFHALDKPPGKSTHWENKNTGTKYTVIPTEKVTINGNPYCRKYQTTATIGDKTHESYGTACVGPDGSWQAVSG